MKYTYRMSFFRPMDADAVERYLSRMARKGWFLSKTGQMFWRFRRGEPASLTYAVTYFPEASVYGGPMTLAQQELAEYCAAAGWEYVAQWLRMQIYVTDRPNPVPLETDERQKLETIQAVFRKNLRVNLLLLALYLLQCLLQSYNISRNLLQYLSSPAALLFLTIWPALALLMTENLLAWTLWLRRSKRSVERGGSCAPSFFRLSRGMEMGVTAIIAVFLLQSLWYSLRSGRGSAVLVGGGFAVLLLLLIYVPVWWMRERGFDEESIRNVTLLIGGVLIVGIIVVALAQPTFQPIEPAWWYEGEEARYGIYDDPIPLRLEDIGVSTEGLPYSTFSRSLSRSPFLSKISADHTCPPEEELPGEQPYLEYTMVHVSFPPLYDLCRQELPWMEMELVEDDRWQAEAVYAASLSDGSPVLLVCWEKDLLLLYSDLIPQLTEEQASVIREAVTSYWK